METVESLERTDRWWEILGGLLPLWMMAVAVTAEGFPHPPITVGMGLALFLGSIALSFLLIFLGWITPIRALYSLLPVVLIFPFDEMSTAYKTPFILAFAAILTVGALICQLIRKGPWGELVLIIVGALALVAASHAAGRYWDWALSLGFGECMPDLPPCPSLAGLGMPWWRLFFGS
jgi:hypothetical protein